MTDGNRIDQNWVWTPGRRGNSSPVAHSANNLEQVLLLRLFAKARKGLLYWYFLVCHYLHVVWRLPEAESEARVLMLLQWQASQEVTSFPHLRYLILSCSLWGNQQNHLLASFMDIDSLLKIWVPQIEASIFKQLSKKIADKHSSPSKRGFVSKISPSYTTLEKNLQTVVYFVILFFCFLRMGFSV